MHSSSVSTRRRFDVHATSITLKRRRMDVKTTSCAYWVHIAVPYLWIRECRMYTEQEQYKELERTLSYKKTTNLCMVFLNQMSGYGSR